MIEDGLSLRYLGRRSPCVHTWELFVEWMAKTDTVGAGLLPNLWDEAHAQGLTPEGRLLYRSNLLAADKRVTNFGGGNTSSKIVMPDPLTGEAVPVLWVKGSGGDLGSMQLDGFATLYLDRLKTLQGLYRGPDHEDEMVALYAHCAFGLNGRAPSIDTPLHGLVDRACVDHMHPDAVIALAASADSRRRSRKRSMAMKSAGWPGCGPGSNSRRAVAEIFVSEHPGGKRRVVLEAHGLFTWGDSDQAQRSMRPRST